MNSFVFFAFILAQAHAQGQSTQHSEAHAPLIQAATFIDDTWAGISSAVNKTSISIKDNEPYTLKFDPFTCDGESTFTISLPKEPAQAYLYPVFQVEYTTKIFNISGENYVLDNTQVVASEGRSSDLPILANHKIKQVVYTSSKKDLKYSVYVLPPKVSLELVNGEPQKPVYNILTVFNCKGKDASVLNSFPIIVTNNARTAALVSSTLVLAISSILLL
ncbi:hypothetical protein DSO57_1005100 [Entomophthora muscae]|uniref:Uncharacterized protein n=1 Tax=Entomophthora muscae TaxID=34485 RepID=A0ACC2SAH6_9FUNG|nr:hypothetical protein DSO57_1005100 [Entomophthora muscae]